LIFHKHSEAGALCVTKITSPTPVIPRSRQGPRSSRWRAPCPRWAFTPTLPHVVYLPIIAHKHDPRISTIRQPFAVVATSDGFRAAYDHNGNMTLRVEVSGTETITYTQEWNAENRLSVVTNTVSGAVTRFVYDGDGNRVLREQPGGSVTAYLGAVEVTLSGTERLTTSYYFASGQRIAMREGVTLTYLHGDHLGSASLATDDAGAQVRALRYTPFGETRYGAAPTDFRFTDQREEDFGWYDYGARLYSPGLGRFVSADMVVPDFATPQSLNRYAYVFNNPLRYIDPTGYDLMFPQESGHEKSTETCIIPLRRNNMPKTRRSYTEAFKREAVRLYEQSGKTQEDIEEELGIGSGCLSRWKKRYGADADTDKLQEQAAQATQIRRLERENEILRQERDILKKAVTIFSQPSR
jgi:RHS repeat-associated protein